MVFQRELKNKKCIVISTCITSSTADERLTWVKSELKTVSMKYQSMHMQNWCTVHRCYLDTPDSQQSGLLLLTNTRELFPFYLDPQIMTPAQRGLRISLLKHHLSYSLLLENHWELQPEWKTTLFPASVMLQERRCLRFSVAQTFHSLLCFASFYCMETCIRQLYVTVCNSKEGEKWSGLHQTDPSKEIWTETEKEVKKRNRP